MAIAGKIGSIYMSTTDASTTFTVEACTDSGDHTTYYISDSDKRYWDKLSTVTVYVDGSPETAVTIQHAGGRVVFSSALTGTEDVTVSGKYFDVIEAGGFSNWSLDSSANLNEITTFGDTYKSMLPTQKEFKVSADAYWFNGDFSDRLGTEIIVALYVAESTDKRYEGYVYISSDSVECGTEDIVTEKIEFTGNGNFYYNEN